MSPGVICLGRRQQPGATPVEGRPARPNNSGRFCCHSRIWSCSDLGSCRIRRKQHPGARSAEERQARPTHRAFAAVLESGDVVTWGDPGFGGDSSLVQEQLRNVQHIQATDYAFAAILESGAVVTWGTAMLGGDSSLVQEQLRNLRNIHAADMAFAAILESGSVISDLGSCRTRRKQQPGARSAEERAARPSNRRCFCCHP